MGLTSEPWGHIALVGPVTPLSCRNTRGACGFLCILSLPIDARNILTCFRFVLRGEGRLFWTGFLRLLLLQPILGKVCFLGLLQSEVPVLWLQGALGLTCDCTNQSIPGSSRLLIFLFLLFAMYVRAINLIARMVNPLTTRTLTGSFFVVLF